MFERPIQPGDVVEVSGTSGKVREIGMRATTLTTFEGADVVVPNGTLLSEKLINWTLSDMNRRIDVDVGVAYGSDPRRVMALLKRSRAGDAGYLARAGAGRRLQGLRPELARLRHPRLDQRFRRLGHDPHRNDDARVRSAGEGRHRDSVPAAGRARPQRRARGGQQLAAARMEPDARVPPDADRSRPAEQRRNIGASAAAGVALAFALVGARGPRWLATANGSGSGSARWRCCWSSGR